MAEVIKQQIESYHKEVKEGINGLVTQYKELAIKIDALEKKLDTLQEMQSKRPAGKTSSKAPSDGFPKNSRLYWFSLLKSENPEDFDKAKGFTGHFLNDFENLLKTKTKQEAGDEIWKVLSKNLRDEIKKDYDDKKKLMGGSNVKPTGLVVDSLDTDDSSLFLNA